MQTDRDAGLARHGAQLAHCGTRSPGHRQGEPGVGKHRPPGRAIGARDEGHGRGGAPHLGERRSERLAHDRAGGPKGIAADPQHRDIAGLHDPGRVGQNIGPALEDEAHHAQRRATLLQRPAVMLEDLDQPSAGGRRVAPGQEAGDHVGAHGLAHRQTSHGPTAGAGGGHVGGIGRCDRRPHILAPQALGQTGEESDDRGFAGRGQGLERRHGG